MIISASDPSQPKTLVVRQRWVTRLVPISVFIVVAGNSLRLAQIFKSPAISSVLVLLNLGVVFYLYRKLPQYNQKLCLDKTGLTLRCGKLISRCRWDDISALRLQDRNYTDRRNSFGLAIERVDGSALSLNASWTIRRKKLIRLLAQQYQAATGNILPVHGRDVGTGQTGKAFLIVGGVIIAMLLFLFVMAAIVRHPSPSAITVRLGVG